MAGKIEKWKGREGEGEREVERGRERERQKQTDRTRQTGNVDRQHTTLTRKDIQELVLKSCRLIKNTSQL